MLEASARVVARHGDALWLQPRLQAGCSQCGQSCGGKWLSSWMDRQGSQLQARDTLGAAVGDQVLIGISEKVLVRASLLFYLAPLLSMAAAAMLAALAGGGDATQALAALCGLFGGLFWVRLRTAAGRVSERYRPRLLAITRRCSDDDRNGVVLPRLGVASAASVSDLDGRERPCTGASR